MNKATLLLVSLCAFASGGCYSVNTLENAQKAARPEVVPDRRISWDSTLAGKLTAGEVIQSTSSGNLRHIQVSVTNNYPYKLEFVYKVEWFDIHGMRLDLPAGGWKRLELSGHETSTIGATATDPGAADFVIKFQEAKGNNTVF
jgi:uncharacterized protein YcfL